MGVVVIWFVVKAGMQILGIQLPVHWYVNSQQVETQLNGIPSELYACSK